MIGEASLTPWLPVLGILVCKSLIVFAVAAAALWGLRRASAALRHLVCLLTLAAVLVLPVLSLALPGWRLPVLSMNIPAVLSVPNSGEAEAPIPSHKFATLPFEGRVMKEKEPAAKGTASAFTLPSEGRDRLGTNVNGPGIGHSPGRVTPFSLAILLPMLWLFGLTFAALRPLLGLWGIAYLSRTSIPITDAPVLHLAEQCAFALRLAATPTLRQADAPVPMTWGGFRPIVLLPLDAQAWPEERLRAVLLHELAHVRRQDWLSHRFADLVCALYWFHPFVWLTARRLRAESEIACDDLVLTSGLAAPDYARHLLDVARALRPVSHIPRAAIAMARTTRIEGRLKIILDPVRSRQALTRRVVLFVLTPGLSALLLLSLLHPTAKAQSAPIPVADTPAPPAASVGPVSVRPSVEMPVPNASLPASHQSADALAAPVPVAPSPEIAPSSLPSVQSKNQYVVPIRLVTPKGPAHSSMQAKSVTINLGSLGKANPLVLTASMVDWVTAADPLKPPMLFVAGDLKINGTTLLAGVTDADKPGGSWWSANGALLPTPVYDTAAYHAENHAGHDTNNVGFAFRLPSDAQDVTVEYELPQSVRSSSDGFWPTKIQENAQRTEAQIFAKTNGARVVTAAFPPSLKKANIRIGIASGAWKTVASINAATNPSGLLHEEDGVKLLLSPLAESIDLSAVPGPPQAVLTVATDTTDDLRVVAIDIQGREVLPLGIGDNSIGTLDQITARFGLRLSQIKEVRVQTRKFQWIELKDIALQPAQ